MSNEKHIENINLAINGRDVSALRKLARKGFVNNELRRKVWPILLGVDCEPVNGNGDDDRKTAKENDNDKHNYWEQIKKDTVRSMNHFDITQNYSSSERQREQQTLERILQGIFMNNRDLHYTQGFHDMCSVFYIVCGEDLGPKLSEALARRHMRDAVRETLNVYEFVLKLLFPLLSLVEPQLFVILKRGSLSSIFALSWVLTWFAHNIEAFDDITRLYDLFLASHPLMPLYLSVSLIKACKNELLRIDKTDTLDQARLHQFFQHYDWNIDWDLIISQTDIIFNKHPPHDLYRQYFIDDLDEVPKDSPFLAKSVNEVESMKAVYSGSNLTSIWCYQNPKFWRYIAIPIMTAVVVFHVAHSHISK